MKSIETVIAVIITIIIITIMALKDCNVIKINIICIASIQRGILSPNKYWWSVTDLMLHDKTGVELFNNIKKTHPQFYRTNLLTKPISLVLDIDIIKHMLDNSPDDFTVGTFKYEFFKPFMMHNVGVASGKKWRYLRTLNESVMDTGKLHRHSHIFDKIIRSSLLNFDISGKNLPTKFDDFSELAKHITNKIVFGMSCPHQKFTYNTLKEANKLPMFPFKVPSYKASQNYINKVIENPKDNTMISLLSEYGQDLSIQNLNTSSSNGTKENILADQVYHFMFPLLAIMTNVIPRVLSLIIAHPYVKNKLLSNPINRNVNNSSVNQTDASVGSINEPYLLKCIWETLRLNGFVISFFRKSVRHGLGVIAGTDFLILTNPILRDPIEFPNPHLFIPDRWTEKLKKSKYNLIFGQGPQKCPGREMALFIMQSYLTAYINILSGGGHNLLSMRNKDENNLYMSPAMRPRISYAINPHKIEFIYSY